MRSISMLPASLFIALAGAAAALDLTPAQTEGPYYPRAKPAETDPDLTRLGNGAAAGEVLLLSGRVIDAAGQPIADARVEIWQADNKGIYLHPGDPRTANRDKAFQFYGEMRSSADGAFAFRTIIPGLYTGRAKHIHAKITPPGGPTLTTQFYFKDDAELARDGIARRLGKGLAGVTLAPARPAAAASAPLEAAVTVVVPRGRG